MREIKFRGKRLDTGNWIYGDLLHWNNKAAILQWDDTDSIDIENRLVSPFTIGEFTGLLDKNGKEIFESDIVRYNFITTGKQTIFKIVWCKYGWCLVDNDEVEYLDSAEWHCGETEIIGNIHDNPELLKQEDL